MKSGILTCITVISLLAVLAMPLRLAAQVEKQEHRRYRVIDLGTLGGTFSEPHGIKTPALSPPSWLGNRPKELARQQEKRRRI